MASRRFKLGKGNSAEPIDPFDDGEEVEAKQPSPVDELNSPLTPTDEQEEKPRRVKRPRNTKATTEKEKPVTLSQKAVAEELALIMGFGCGMAGLVTKHPEIWNLDEREQNELGKALAEAIPSLPAKQAKAIAEKLPTVRLAIVAGQIFVPRIVMEFNLRKQELLLAQMQHQQTQANGMANAPTSSQPGGPFDHPDKAPQKPTVSFEIPGLNN